jgi:diaminohydroxyphosphoribosylaminopyrimidine deaminase/5-amino-6-(5-phosphoribosylamino)uracil reductase
MSDEQFMSEAIALAEKGRGLTAPNPVVGCVIVRDGKIVGRGYHRRYGACHAETAAIDDAGRKARGGTLYVTLQPCNHFGKTPPCTDAVVKSGVKRVVIAARDPNPKTKCDEGLNKLRKAGIKVEFGVNAAQAERQNEVYFFNLAEHRPFVALKLASTLDAKIADFQEHSQWITGDESRELVHRLRSQHAAILVGSRTVQTDDPRLTSRLPGKRPQPLRVVLAPELDLPLTASVFKQRGEAIVFCAPDARPERRRAFEKKGIRLFEAGRTSDGLLDWKGILGQLYAQDITSVLVEGGARVAASALSAGIVNKLYLFLAPMILGGGISYAEELRPRKLEQAIRFKEWHTTQVGNDLLIEAYL